MEDVNTRRRIFLSLSKLGCGLQKFNSRKFHLHLTFKASWNNRDDAEKTRIRFNSDVFTAVAVVVAKAPYSVGRRQRTIKPRGRGFHSHKGQRFFSLSHVVSHSLIKANAQWEIHGFA